MYFVYMVVIWIFILTIEGKVRKYEVGNDCDGMISMDTSGINGIDVLMYMTADLVPLGLGGCRLFLDKHVESEYLHFYFSDIFMANCQDVSLRIYTGESVKVTSPYSELPYVCGSSQDVDVHYRSDERYLLLDVTWGNTSVRGTVFRFIANTYTCDQDCTATSKCYAGPCTELKREKNYDFCHKSIQCKSSATGHGGDTKPGGLSAGHIVMVAIGSLLLCIFCRAYIRSRQAAGRSENCVLKCLDTALERFCGALRSLCEGIRSSVHYVRKRLVEWYRRIEDALYGCLCKTPQTPEQTATDTPTSPPSTVVIETSTDDITPEYVYDNEVSEEEPGVGAPPSYSAALAMPRSPIDPPSYLASQDTPPDYQHVVANKTTFGLSK